VKLCQILSNPVGAVYTKIRSKGTTKLGCARMEK
jgi:hypothetical protein